MSIFPLNYLHYNVYIVYNSVNLKLKLIYNLHHLEIVKLTLKTHNYLNNLYPLQHYEAVCKWVL